jgi:hypothetical protein
MALGSGKTAVAQTITEHWAGTGELTGAFSSFFHRGQPGRDTSNQLPTTIAFQIAMAIQPELQVAIRLAVINHPYILFKSLDAQVLKLLVEPLHATDLQQNKTPRTHPFS